MFMKSMIKLPLVAVAFAMAIPFTQAQDAGTPPPPPPAGEHGPNHGAPSKGMRGDRFKMLAEKLALTPEQQVKIKPIIEDEAKALKAVMDDASLDREAKRPKMDEIRKAHREQFLPLLTPEQVKKLDGMKENRAPGGPRKEKAAE